MNKELFQSMQKQMTPGAEVRAALSDKLAQPVKRRTPVHKYVAVAACAALVIGAFPLYQAMKSKHEDLIPSLHSYVTVEGLTGSVYVAENATTIELGCEETDLSTGTLPVPNTGDQSEAAMRYEEFEAKAIAQLDAINAYQKLMGHFSFGYPNWYGGAYIDDNNNLMVLLVSSKDTGDKSLEQKVLRWTGSDKVVFGSAKYSLQELHDLQDKVCDAMMELGLFSGCGTDEEFNRLNLTLTSVTDEALAILARLDPEDDAIYVEVGQLATTNDLASEDPAVQHVMPGGATVPEDDGLIAYEPYYDGAKYDLEHLPEELPESKQPAIQIQSVPEEDAAPPRTEDASTASYDPNR